MQYFRERDSGQASSTAAEVVVLCEWRDDGDVVLWVVMYAYYRQSACAYYYLSIINTVAFLCV